jgi:hypothetical protein
MEWLILLTAFVYLALSLTSDGFDALLYWARDNPSAVARALGGMLLTGVISALWKGHVTATIYVAGLLGGLIQLAFEWLKSRDAH